MNILYETIASVRWFMSAAIAALLPATIQTTAAHSMGGGHGGMPMALNFSNGRGFGNFEQRQDFAFRHHGGDRFFFDHQNRFFFGFDFAALEVWGTGFASRAILALEEALCTKASLFLISIAFMSQCLLREKVATTRWISAWLIFVRVGLAVART